MGGRTISVEIVGDSSSLERALGKAQTSGQKFGQKLASASKLAAVGLAAAAVGAFKSVQAASSLEEQMNKTSAVFGKSAPAIQRWAKTTASSIGVSNRAALEAAGTFGNMLKPMGVAVPVAAAMSTKMVQLAADMASFNDASPEETLEALRSGLAGETEPLRRFGVFLNAARVEEEALRLGLIKQGQELNAAGKAQATYALIMKDTADAQGDFAATSDTLANRERVLRARIEDVSAKLGGALLPAAEKITGVVLKLTDFTEKHSTATKVLAAAVASLTIAVIGANVAWKVYTAAVRAATIAQLLLNAAMRANPVVAVVSLLILLGTALVLAWKRSEKFRAIVTGAFNAVRDGALSMVASFLGSIDKLLAGLESVLHVAGKMPGPLGKPFRAMEDAVEGARAKVQGLQDTVNKLKSKHIDITVTVHSNAAAVLEHIALIRAQADTRQHGGPVSAGRPYVVGEAGPELFIPSRSGRIAPNARTSAAPAQAQMGSGPGHYMIMADREFVSWLRQLDWRTRRGNGGRGILT